MCKSFHEESLELPSEASAVDGDPQEGLECLFFCCRREGRRKGGPTTFLFSVWENKPSCFKYTNLELRRKQSQGKLACNTRQSEHICQMSEIGSGCVALCVFLILGNKGPLFPREAAGRNLALWLALVSLLCAAFSCISWYHPSQQQLMRQDTRQQPHRNKRLAQPEHYFCSTQTHAQIHSKIPLNTRNGGQSEEFAINSVGYIFVNCFG